MFKKINKCDIVLIFITIIFTVIVYVFQNQNSINVSLYNSSSLGYAKATVIEVVEDQTQEDEQNPGRYYGVQNLYVEILEGSHQGNKVYIDNYLSSTHNVRLHIRTNIHCMC